MFCSRKLPLGWKQFLIIIHQIFLLAHDWSKCGHHMTKYSPAKPGEYLKIFPDYFQNCACCKKYLKDNKHNSLHLSADKYPSTFLC